MIVISSPFNYIQRPELDLSYVYLSYDDVTGLSESVRPKSAKASARKSAASARSSKGSVRAPSAQR